MPPASPRTASVLRSSADRLVRNWRFSPSTPSMLTRLRRARLYRRGSAPRSQILRVPWPSERWNCLFLFAPKGVLDVDQEEILTRLRALAGRLLVVVATPTPDRIPAAVTMADALIWKDLPGFDFSAYALALDAIARFAAGAMAYVQNDSVLGPFGDLDALIRDAPWDLTGFIGSPAVENHFSSFAFVLKQVTTMRMKALAPVVSTSWSYDDFVTVVMLQETRFARTASRAMTVGSLWYLPVRPTEPSLAGKVAQRLGIVRGANVHDIRGDATLSFPLALLDHGFPFLKRSLFTKYAGLVPEAELRARLAEMGWHRSS